jgi:hypothetical protein
LLDRSYINGLVEAVWEDFVSEEMKQLVLLLANAVAGMEDEKAQRMQKTSTVAEEIRRLTEIIRKRGG